MDASLPPATSATPAGVPELAYAPPPRWHQRPAFRRRLRLYVPVVAVLLAAAAVLFVPHVRERVRVLYRQRQCMAYTPPQGSVAYDDDPGGSAALRRTPGYAASGPAAVRTNLAWRAYAGPMLPVAFMHRRHSPGGNERLVAVQFGESGGGRSADPLGRLSLTPYVPLPGTLVRPRAGAATLSAGLDMCRTPGTTTRLFEGRIDPADPSHFTIDYVHDGTAGTIDGWLNDDDTVTLSPRSGRVATGPGGDVWWSPAGAAMPDWVARTGTLRDAATQPVRPPGRGSNVR